jgi:predicted neutral ceramidase superfamily lipid hydrolase
MYNNYAIYFIVIGFLSLAAPISFLYSNIITQERTLGKDLLILHLHMYTLCMCIGLYFLIPIYIILGQLVLTTIVIIILTSYIFYSNAINYIKPALIDYYKNITLKRFIILLCISVVYRIIYSQIISIINIKFGIDKMYLLLIGIFPSIFIGLALFLF